MEFVAKILDMEAFGKYIIVLGVNDAKRLGVMSSDRVRLSAGGSEVVAILNTASEFPEGCLGVFKEDVQAFRLAADKLDQIIEEHGVETAIETANVGVGGSESDGIRHTGSVGVS